MGEGAYSGRDWPGFEQELSEVSAVIWSLLPTEVLDVGCGTGFVTGHLRGEVTGLNQSAAMLR